MSEMVAGIFENNIDSNASTTSHFSILDYQTWTKNLNMGIKPQDETSYKNFSSFSRVTSTHNQQLTPSFSLNYPNHQMLFNPYYYSNQSFFKNLKKYLQFKSHSRVKESWNFYEKSFNKKNIHEKCYPSMEENTSVILIDDEDQLNTSLHKDESVERYIKLTSNHQGNVLEKEVFSNDSVIVESKTLGNFIDVDFPLDLSCKKAKEKEKKVIFIFLISIFFVEI